MRKCGQISRTADFGVMLDRGMSIKSYIKHNVIYVQRSFKERLANRLF